MPLTFRNEITEPGLIGGGVIVAIMFLAVFIGGANAGDCTRSQSAESPAAKGHH